MNKIQLGRRYAPDKRDQQYPMRACLPRASARQVRYWKDNYWIGNQGPHPYCVGFAWTGWLEAGPIRPITRRKPCINPAWIYNEAQKVDEWPGESYEGTSVRAGAKVLQKAGYIQSYHWTTDFQDIKRVLLDIGPVVVGTNWHTRMNNPRNGIIRARGKLLGGHAYMLTGINCRRRLVRILNSWGTSWGRGGHAFIPFGDLAKLIRAQGEVCLAVEIPKEG